MNNRLRQGAAGLLLVMLLLGAGYVSAQGVTSASEPTKTDITSPRSGRVVESAPASPGVTSDFLPRANYGARLEPVDKVLHGAGLTPDPFGQYWQQMDERTRPTLYMFYTALQPEMDPIWSQKGIDMCVYLGQLKATLEHFSEKYSVYLLPQIGLYLSPDKESGAPSPAEVAEGKYDKHIDVLCDALSRLGRPFYLRIGYECNGPWNAYTPEPYKAAFARISKVFRARIPEAAMVWCVIAKEHNFGEPMDYYPGDEYVDWWAIDLFSTNSLASPETMSFLKQAQEHGKPVMIAESTPMFVGVLDGESSWDKWFEPYFDLIRSQPGIKAFCYVNFDWKYWSEKWSQPWSDWGDCRLEKNEIVAKRYLKEMKSPLYQHGESETKTRAFLKDRRATSVR